MVVFYRGNKRQKRPRMAGSYYRIAGDCVYTDEQLINLSRDLSHICLLERLKDNTVSLRIYLNLSHTSTSAIMYHLEMLNMFRNYRIIYTYRSGDVAPLFTNNKYEKRKESIIPMK